jgi:subtilase family serine protease
MLGSTRYISAHFKRSLLVCIAVAGVALGTFALVAPDSGAATKPMALPGSVVPHIPAGAARLGAVAAAQQVSVEVTLNLRNQAQLDALLAGQADPASPYYHQYLSAAQFDAAFGPTADQVTQVENSLRAVGLTPGQPSDDRLSIPVTGTAAQVQRAFGTTLASYRLKGGRVAYANTSAPQVQAGVAPLIQGVIGLDNLFQAHSMMAPKAKSDATARAVKAALAAHPMSRAGTAAAAAAPKCAAAFSAWPLTFDTFFALFYGLSQLYSLGDAGAGSKVAILELEPNLPSDITAFKSCYGLSTAVSYTQVDGGIDGVGTTGAGTDEAALDIEIVAALAPKSAINVYQGPNSDQGIFDIVNKFAAANAEKTMSVSWGGCEAEGSPAAMNALETVFKKTAAQGQSVLASSGDTGSTGCYIDGGAKDTRLSATFPASAPYVTAVGGTDIVEWPNNAGLGEVVWNESNFTVNGVASPLGAGGGAVSAQFCMPKYQYQTAIPGLANTHLAPASACSSTTDPAKNPAGYHREIPDVSADADPTTGYGIFYNGSWVGGIGGTSAAAPLWAAIAALTDVSPYCRDYASGSAGAQPAALYAATARYHSFIYGASPNALYDVLPVGTVSDGNGGTMTVPKTNDYLPSGYTGSLFPSTTGDDIATGLGTPLVNGISGSSLSTYFPGYTAMICQQLKTKALAVTSVSPNAGKSNTAAKVTIHGTGFLTTGGAMRVRVYHGATLLTTLIPGCTTTACTVTLPKEGPMTVDLRVSAEMSGYTPVVGGDKYAYANPPKITSFSPAKGTHSGGTKVTVKGANFIGVKSVTFNGKAGTKVTVSGTTVLTVITPAGTKGATVKLVINSAGGTSNAVTYTYT